jgi:CBS domain-containing protein
MLVSDIMHRRVKACYLGDSLEQVVNKMTQNNIGFIPVVDFQGKLTDVITDRDIIFYNSILDKPLSQIRCLDLSEHRQIYSCHPSDNIKKALNIMRAIKIHRLPVVDEDNMLMGVLGLTDIIENTKLNDLTKIPPKETLSTLQGVFTN